MGHAVGKPQLFVDLDGVVAAFDEHVESLFGFRPGDPKVSDAEMWAYIETEPTFWLDIPVKWGAEALFEVVKPHNPIFLTGVPLGVNGERAHAQKPAWVKRHFGDWPVITTKSRLKQTHMKAPGDILVDDRWRVLKKWKEAGGVAVHYRDAYQAIADLKKALGIE